jgi:hypothetical protein
MVHEVDRGCVDQDIEFFFNAGLSKMVTERSQFDLTVPWSGDTEIKSR